MCKLKKKSQKFISGEYLIVIIFMQGNSFHETEQASAYVYLDLVLLLFRAELKKAWASKVVPF
jgi:hypothetical protein